MGRGNWFPGSSLEDCEVAYVQIRGFDDEEEDEDLDNWAYSDFKFILKEALGKTFEWDPSYRDVCNRFDGLGRDDVCMAYNGLFGVFVDGQGDIYHYGIGVLIRSDAPSFAKSRQYEFARKLFDRFQQVYYLSVRTSAWTSCPRQ